MNFFTLSLCLASLLYAKEVGKPNKEHREAINKVATIDKSKVEENLSKVHDDNCEDDYAKVASGLTNPSFVINNGNTAQGVTENDMEQIKEVIDEKINNDKQKIVEERNEQQKRALEKVEGENAVERDIVKDNMNLSEKESDDIFGGYGSQFDDLIDADILE